MEYSFNIGQKVTEEEIEEEGYELLAVTPLGRYYHSKLGWLRVIPAHSQSGIYIVTENNNGGY